MKRRSFEPEREIYRERRGGGERQTEAERGGGERLGIGIVS